MKSLFQPERSLKILFVTIPVSSGYLHDKTHTVRSGRKFLAGVNSWLEAKAVGRHPQQTQQSHHKKSDILEAIAPKATAI